MWFCFRGYRKHINTERERATKLGDQNKRRCVSNKQTVLRVCMFTTSFIYILVLSVYPFFLFCSPNYSPTTPQLLTNCKQQKFRSLTYREQAEKTSLGETGAIKVNKRRIDLLVVVLWTDLWQIHCFMANLPKSKRKLSDSCGKSTKRSAKFLWWITKIVYGHSDLARTNEVELFLRESKR